jgi:hypothetical protein
VRVQKRKFNQKQMMEREQLLICNLGCFSLALRKRVESMRANAGVGEPLKTSRAGAGSPLAGSGKARDAQTGSVLGAVGQALESTDLQPISYVHTVGETAPVLVALNTLSSDTATIKHGGRAGIMLGQAGVLTLQDGETLISASKDTTVKSGKHDIKVTEGTIALVSREGAVTKVRNLWENVAHSIQVSVGGKYVKISAGQELLIGPNGSSLTKSMKGDLLGRRHIRNYDLSREHSVTKSEVSLVSLMQNHSILTRVVKSENESDKDIAAKLMKMAAALSVVTAKRGAYAAISP